MENPEVIGQGVGAFFMMVAAAYALIRGHKKADGSTPAERPPSPHEVKQAISNMQSQIDRAAMDEKVAIELLRAVKKLIEALEQTAEALGDNTEMSQEMRGDIRDVARDLRSLATELIRSGGRG